MEKVIITENQITNSKTYLNSSEMQKHNGFDWNKEHMVDHYSNLLTVARLKGLDWVLNIQHVKESQFKKSLLKELISIIK